MVRVTWRDAAPSEDAGWKVLEAAAFELAVVTSVGYLVFESDTAVGLAQDVSFDADGVAWVNGHGVIPRACIVTLERLTVLSPRLEVA